MADDAIRPGESPSAARVRALIEQMRPTDAAGLAVGTHLPVGAPAHDMAPVTATVAETRKTVPHVRGDVAAPAMMRKGGLVPGRQYAVAVRCSDVMSLTFIATYGGASTDAGGREQLVFDNGVTLHDALGYARFEPVD